MRFNFLVAALRLATIGVGCASTSGCLAVKAVTAPVKLAATSVIVAGEAAGAVVTNTGKLAVSAANATGSIGSTSLDSAAQLAQSGMVTFVDAANGTIVRVPWQEGMTVAGAGHAARIELGRRAIDVIRASKVIYSASRIAGEGAPLSPGDVVRLSR